MVWGSSLHLGTEWTPWAGKHVHSGGVGRSKTGSMLWCCTASKIKFSCLVCRLMYNPQCSMICSHEATCSAVYSEVMQKVLRAGMHACLRGRTHTHIHAEHLHTLTAHTHTHIPVVCVCLFRLLEKGPERERERQRARESARERERVCVFVCACVSVGLSVHVSVEVYACCKIRLTACVRACVCVASFEFCA